MADQEALKAKLERMKKLAENCIDEAPPDYRWETEYIYTHISSLIQKINMDESDKLKEKEE